MDQGELKRIAVTQLKKEWDDSRYRELVAPAISANGIGIDYLSLVQSNEFREMRIERAHLIKQLADSGANRNDLKQSFKNQNVGRRLLQNFGIDASKGQLQDLVTLDSQETEVIQSVIRLHKIDNALSLNYYVKRGEVDGNGVLWLKGDVNSFASINTRASSRSVNLMGLPKQYKKHWVSPYRDYPVLIEADLQSADAYFAAQLSGSKNLQSDVKCGLYDYWTEFVISITHAETDDVRPYLKTGLIAWLYAGSNETVQGLFMRSPAISYQLANQLVQIVTHRYRNVVKYFDSVASHDSIMLYGNDTGVDATGLRRAIRVNADVASAPATLIKRVAGQIAETHKDMRVVLTIHDSVVVGVKTPEDANAAFAVIDNALHDEARNMGLDTAGLTIHHNQI